jgi:hypothetical protein
VEESNKQQARDHTHYVEVQNCTVINNATFTTRVSGYVLYISECNASEAHVFEHEPRLSTNLLICTGVFICVFVVDGALTVAAAAVGKSEKGIGFRAELEVDAGRYSGL